VAFGIEKGSGNSQNDVTIFKKGTFGTTADGNVIDPNKDIAAVQAQAGNTLPQVSAGGQITLTLHQVNADGAGPFACSIDTAATGTFKDATVVTNVDGKNGVSNAANQDFVRVRPPSYEDREREQPKN
jgi:Egh16-like virulence factor